MLSAAVLAGWSAAEWRVRASELCDSFTVQVQEALERQQTQKERRREERDMKGEKQEEEEDDYVDEEVLCEADEVELELLLSSFLRPAVGYLDERRLLQVGMDERVVLVLAALQVLCHHVLSHSAVLSVDGQIRLLSLFPDLAALSDEQVQLWMLHQREKLRSLLQRILAQHRQHSTAQVVQADSSSPFAASVLDVFTVLSATASGYFDHLLRLAPFGLSTFSSFLSSLDGAVVEYVDAVVAAMGQPRTLIPYGDDECKLKQSEEWEAEHPSLLMKQAKRLQRVAEKHPTLRLSAVEQASKSSTRKALDELSARSSVDRTDPSSLASHPIAELCVHTASVQAAVDMLADLQTQIRLAWTQLEQVKPQVKQKAKALAQEEDKDEDEQPLASAAAGTAAGRAGAAGHASSSASSFAAPTPSTAAASSADALLRLSAGTTSHLFPSATARLYEQKKRACELLSTAVVFVEWRDALLVDLYNPSVADGSRVVGGPLLDAVNASMPRIYRALQPSVFPVLCQHLLSHLCLGLSYVLVYGRRVVEQADVQSCLLPDILAVELLFASELSALTVESCCHAYRRLLSVVGWSTEKLLAQYADYDSKRVAVPRTTLARIIGLRRGSLVGHFMKTERSKQKQQQQQLQHSHAHSTAAASTSSSASAGFRLAVHSSASASRAASKGSTSSASLSASSPPNPFAEAQNGHEGVALDAEWELVDGERHSRLPTALPASASFPPPHRPSTSSQSSTEAIPITDLLARNAVHSPTTTSSSSSSSSSSSTASSAQQSLQKTQRALSHGLSSGLNKGKLLFSQLKARAV